MSRYINKLRGEVDVMSRYINKLRGEMLCLVTSTS